jgi:hypothetical protein
MYNIEEAHSYNPLVENYYIQYKEDTVGLLKLTRNEEMTLSYEVFDLLYNPILPEVMISYQGLSLNEIKAKINKLALSSFTSYEEKEDDQDIVFKIIITTALCCKFALGSDNVIKSANSKNVKKITGKIKAREYINNVEVRNHLNATLNDKYGDKVQSISFIPYLEEITCF